MARIEKCYELAREIYAEHQVDVDAAVAQLEPNETGTIRMTLKDDNEVRFIPAK